MFKKNFIDLCNKKKIAPTAACKELGLSAATFSCWTDQSVPRRATLQRMAEYFGVPISDLVDGPSIATIAREEKGAPRIDEETFAKFSKDGVTVSICDHPDTEHQTNELWNKIRRLSPENRNKVDGYVSALLDEQDREEIAKTKNA